MLATYSERSYAVYECPSDTGPRAGYPSPDIFRGINFFDLFGTSYVFNTGAWVMSTKIPMQVDPAYRLNFHDWGCWGRAVENFADPSRQVLVSEWSFYWLISEESPSWWDGRFFVLHGDLGAEADADRVSMNLACVDGHVEFDLLRHAPYHYTNEDYTFASEPLD
jgi:hypothetical protein